MTTTAERPSRERRDGATKSEQARRLELNREAGRPRACWHKVLRSTFTFEVHNTCDFIISIAKKHESQAARLRIFSVSDRRITTFATGRLLSFAIGVGSQDVDVQYDVCIVHTYVKSMCFAA